MPFLMDSAIYLVFFGRLGIVRFSPLSGALILIHIVLLLGFYFLKTMQLRCNLPSTGYEVRDRGVLRLPSYILVSETCVPQYHHSLIPKAILILEVAYFQNVLIFIWMESWEMVEFRNDSGFGFGNH